MGVFLGFACFVLIIAFLLGMIKPSLVLKKKFASRERVSSIYGGAFIIVVIVGIIIDPPKDKDSKQQEVASTATVDKPKKTEEPKKQVVEPKIETVSVQKVVEPPAPKIPKDPTKEPIKINKLLSVSDFPYTMGDKQAVSVSLGPNIYNYLDFTIHRSNVYEGKSFRSERRKNKQITASLHWNGKNYFQSINAQTWISLDILKLTDDVAILRFSAQFTDHDNNKLVRVAPSKIELTGEHLHNFITMPQERDS